MTNRRIRRRLAVVFSAMLVFTGTNCALAANGTQVSRVEAQTTTSGPTDTAEPVRPKLDPTPVAIASDPVSVRVFKQAAAAKGSKILVSIAQRQLWLITNKDTLLVAPVAVGMGKDFEYNGKKFHFATPMGRRKVLSKSLAPIWTVPEWHYMERATSNGHTLHYLKPNEKVKLADGTSIEVRGKDVGRVNTFGNFWAFDPGLEIMYDDKVFVPPITTNQRRVPDALGPYKLDTGDGYLIHGTHIYNEDEIGEAVSHGCVRMDNFDLERLYYMVDAGAPVFIF